MHVYNNEPGVLIALKSLLTVKILLISKLFIGKIWRFGEMFVLLHSLLRNTLSLLATKERVL